MNQPSKSRKFAGMAVIFDASLPDDAVSMSPQTWRNIQERQHANGAPVFLIRTPEDEAAFEALSHKTAFEAAAER